jgi:prepilin-type processing-associated H-X9-DG protein/prepilin-type N-terminal cleavage/methylation domain-containing protein
MMTGEAEGSGPFTVEISVGPAEDQFGNVVRDGTLLTVVVDSGNVVSGDADSDLAGHQIVLTNGRGGFYVEIPTADTEFVAVLYADAEMETELGAANYSGPPPMPLGGVCVLAALLGILGAWMCRGKALAPARGRRAGFTLVELLVVIGIIGVLAAILLPALSRARQMAYQTQCLSNLKQLYMANTMYASEWNGRYAPAAPDIEVGYGGTIRWHGVRERPFPDSEFDPNRGPLAEYLPDARIKQCPSFLQFSKKGDVDNAFESSTGGYGYNMAYIGGTSYSSSWPQNAKRTTRDSRVHDPSSVIMFADAAMPQIDANGSHYLVEYSFVEPPLFPTPSHPHGNPDWGYAAPSIHFRHNGRANVLWADGHATSEKWEWAEPRTNIFGGDNYRWGVGWFGPKDNSLFDVLPEDDYGFLFNAR